MTFAVYWTINRCQESALSFTLQTNLETGIPLGLPPAESRRPRPERDAVAKFGGPSFIPIARAYQQCSMIPTWKTASLTCWLVNTIQ